MHGKQADTRPALPGDRRRAFGNRRLGRLGVTGEEGSSARSGGACPDADNGRAQAGSFLQDKQERASLVFLEQPRKEREGRVTFQSFIHKAARPSPPCSFIPRVSLERREVQGMKRGSLGLLRDYVPSSVEDTQDLESAPNSQSRTHSPDPQEPCRVCPLRELLPDCEFRAVQC